MPNEIGFQGEIEFDHGILPGKGFGEFETLWNIDLIHELAGEFSSSLELMPYQKAGDVKRLLVSVYIASKSKKGSVIAVLTRDPYPKDWNDLNEIMRTAIERLDHLDRLEAAYKRDSFVDARKALLMLSEKIQQFR